MNTEFYRRTITWIGSPWGIAVFATLALVSLVAMTPALGEMQDHGVGFDELQSAGTTERATELVRELGEEGRRAAWIVLVIELPFLIGFGVLIAAWCLTIAELLAKIGRATAARALRIAAWCGPIAAACDLIQNVAVVFVLNDHVGQPAPRISEVGGHLTWAFVNLGVLAIAAGVSLLVLRRLTQTRRMAQSD